MLKFFTTIFVQNTASKDILTQTLKTNIKSIVVAGDTRFDRVLYYLKAPNNNQFEWVSRFKNNKPIVVVGSSWKKDEALFLSIPHHHLDLKYIIAPHEIHRATQCATIFQKSICYSQIQPSTPLQHYTTIIIDNIGMLANLYHYADIVYVGGGFTKSGIHNILEPCVFGKPLIIGPRFNKYQEAIDLNNLKGLMVVHHPQDLIKSLSLFINDKTFTQQKSLLVKKFVEINAGATKIIYENIKYFL